MHTAVLSIGLGIFETITEGLFLHFGLPYSSMTLSSWKEEEGKQSSNLALMTSVALAFLFPVYLKD